MIRRASTQDLAWVAGMLRRANLPLHGLESAGVQLFIKEEQARIVGAVALEPYPPYGLLRSLVVDPRERGKGHGRELLRHILELARAQRLSTVYALTTTIGPMLARHGFEEVPRDQIARPVHQSPELRGACPADAKSFRLRLRDIAPNPATGPKTPPNPTTRF